ncbi:MAG: hypothetical protein IPH13_19050 [Planctomycetes bacterium]|nr:hypothetical protein [Planctomycetota bacterium]MCC7169623.1 hypothetical protein [Planctomycetota bacterium]
MFDSMSRRHGIALIALASSLVAGTEARAADVQAFVSKSGDLVVKGSEVRDDISVFYSPGGNYWAIQSTMSPTTINGFTAATFNGVARDVVFDMGGGDDRVDFAGIAPRDLRMRLGLGEDFFGVNNASIGRDLRVEKSADRDAFSVDVTGIGRDLRVKSAAPGIAYRIRTSKIGRDAVVGFGTVSALGMFGATKLEDTSIGRKLALIGTSPEAIEVTNVTVDGKVDIRATVAFDAIAIDDSLFHANVDVRGASDVSVSIVESTFEGRVRIVAGKGQISTFGVTQSEVWGDLQWISNTDETLTSFIHPTWIHGNLRMDLRSKTSTWSWLSKLDVSGSIDVRTKDGADNLTYTESACGSDVRFDLRGGDNEFTLSAVTIGGDLDLRSGKGNDDVTFFEVDLDGAQNVKTGAGVDTFVVIP